jgi:hypothetical protein
MFAMLRLLFCVVACIFSVNSYASIFVGGGVGVTDGAILEAGYKMNPFISFRGRLGYLPSVNLKSMAGALETNTRTPFASIDKLEMKSQSFDIGAEITPLPFVPIIRGIRLIGALQYLNTDFDIVSNVSGGTTIGNTTYAQSGNVHAQVSNKQTFAPYIGIGWDIINIPFISLRLTGGATFRSFEVSQLYVTGDLVGAVSQADLNQEKAELSKEIDKNIVIPSITLTARFNMINIPFIPIL